MNLLEGKFITSGLFPQQLGDRSYMIQVSGECLTCCRLVQKKWRAYGGHGWGAQAGGLFESTAIAWTFFRKGDMKSLPVVGFVHRFVAMDTGPRRHKQHIKSSEFCSKMATESHDFKRRLESMALFEFRAVSPRLVCSPYFEGWYSSTWSRGTIKLNGEREMLDDPFSKILLQCGAPVVSWFRFTPWIL